MTVLLTMSGPVLLCAGSAGVFMYLFIDGLDPLTAGVLAFIFVLNGLISLLIGIEVILNRYLRKRKTFEELSKETFSTGVIVNGPKTR